MGKLLAVFCLALPCSLAIASPGQAATKVDLDSKGRLHIISVDGRDHIIRPRKWQSGGGFADVKIAPQGKSVGWLAKQMLAPFEGGTNYSYAVALELDIWRGGRVIQRFSPVQAIRDWLFLKNGDQVALHTRPLHGQEFYDCTLFDVKTGKQLAHWALDRKDYKVPDWAKELLVNDPPPGPDEISNWFPDAPASTQSGPKHPQR